jgi:hypothetical protein
MTGRSGTGARLNHGDGASRGRGIDDDRSRRIGQGAR